MTSVELPADLLEDRFAVRGFHLAHAAMLTLLVSVHVAGDGGRPGLAVALAVASAAWSLAADRLGWLADEGLRSSIVVWVGLLVPWIALVQLETFYLQALFTVFPLTFATLPGWWSFPAAAIPCTTWSVAEWRADGGVVEWFVLPLVIWLLSCAFALWIARVIDQSEERAQLLADLASTRAELAEVEREEAVRSERERMAREIHDTLAQGFTSIVLHSRATLGRIEADHPAAATLRLVEGVASEHLAEARRLVHAGPRDTLGGQSLVDALRRVAESEPPVAHLHLDGELSGLGGAVDVAVLRISQEAVANARKHAAAGRIDVTVSRTGDQLLLDVVDDGRGFLPGDEPTDVAGSVGGHGLGGMRRRVEELGGELVVDTAPGTGTSISVALPIVSTTAELPSAGAPS
ncbi:MAG: sensor histidine kinase [Actinomycetota bacterium]